jgi:hypothetical protein
VACLESKVDSLQASINSLIISISSANRARSSTPSSRSGTPHGRAPSPSRRRDPTMCYYHSTFGDRALKCNKPCSFQGNVPTSQ